MKIAIIVHGRFHAFDLARALMARGHTVTLFTNYPGWAVEQFGISRQNVCGFVTHGVLARLVGKTPHAIPKPVLEAILQKMFGQWAASQVQKEHWDVVHCWSGVAEELLQLPKSSDTLRLMMRGSSHIRIQSRLLEQEVQRTGVLLDRPSPWMITREEREYALADKISVLSTFAHQSFLAEGVPADKLCVLHLGAETKDFRPSLHSIEDRRQRILSNTPLRILNVGTFSLRKGMWDMAAVIQELHGRNFEFRFVGPTANEAIFLANALQSCATFVPKQPQARLPKFYDWGDIFALPTIEDGFGAVLGQASAAALAIITTTNGAGQNIVHEGKTGWVLPIRDPKAFVERLHWCNTHRKELAEMVWRIYDEYQLRDWNDVAADFERICKNN